MNTFVSYNGVLINLAHVISAEPILGYGDGGDKNVEMVEFKVRDYVDEHRYTKLKYVWPHKLWKMQVATITQS